MEKNLSPLLLEFQVTIMAITVGINLNLLWSSKVELLENHIVNIAQRNTKKYKYLADLEVT